MSYLGTELVKILVNTQKAVDPYPIAIKSGACELSLGSEVFMTDSKDRKKEFLLQDKEHIVINPGQFALLLTHEKVNIPIDKIAFISIKASIKLRGLINVSGFHVDPGFKGNLVFSVYNAGSGPISLVKGEACFLLWFAELQLVPGETMNYATEDHDHKGQDSIPPQYIDALLAGELASPNVLSKKIDDVQKELGNRINLIEKEQTAKDYLVKTAVGLGIIIILKFVLDWAMYKNGYNEGIEIRSKQITADSIINNLLDEKKRLLLEIDSLNKKVK